MNIFVLGTTPQESASYAVDAHLNKQILECFQMIALRYPGQLPKINGEPYGMAHENHTLAKWVSSSAANALFALKYAVAFCMEANSRKYINLYGSYPFEIAHALISLDAGQGRCPDPTHYPLYIPEYIRAKLFSQEYGETYDLGYTPKLVPDIEVAAKGYKLFYVLEKYRSMEKFEWSCRIPEWYIDMCVKLGRPPF